MSDLEPVKEAVLQNQQFESFTTSRGSIYTYDNEGKVTRYKTIKEELQPRMDITVFANLTPDEQQKLVDASQLISRVQKVYVLERQENDIPKIIRDVKEIKDKNRLYIGIVEDNRVTFNKPAILTPKKGLTVFETRSYQDHGEWFTERHIGHEVTDIRYRS